MCAARRVCLPTFVPWHLADEEADRRHEQHNAFLRGDDDAAARDQAERERAQRRRQGERVDAAARAQRIADGHAPDATIQVASVEPASPATPRTSAMPPPAVSRRPSLQQPATIICEVSFQQMVTTFAAAPTESLADAVECVHAALLQRGVMMTPLIPAARRGTCAMLRCSFNTKCFECEAPGIWSSDARVHGALICCSGRLACVPSRLRLQS